MLKSKSIDEKVDIFYNIVKVSMKCIPIKRVKISTKDKQWITPVLKLLITKRWNAFRGKNFDLYNYYKKKINFEIKKAKAPIVQNLLAQRTKQCGML